MNITLSADLKNFVQNLVLSGSYPGPEEVVNKALLLLKRQEELRREIQIGIDQFDRGEYVSGEEAFTNMNRKVQSF